MIFDLQKASMFKRISAYLFDFIMLAILAVGLGFIISSLTGYDAYSAALNDAYDKYEAEYAIEFEIDEDTYKAMPDEERAAYDAAYNALVNDADAMHAYNMVLNLTLVIITLAILLAYAVLEFVVPILFGNGQTLGKKIFGIALMRTDGVKISSPLLFIRTILGKFTIETMIPVLILIMIYFNSIGVVGMIVLLLILILEISLMISTKTNSLIHDVLAKTVAVDLASQMIFDTEEDMIAYKNKVQAEKAARETY